VSILTIAVCALVIGGFALANLLMPDPEVLTSERRRPAELVAFTPENLASAYWMSSFEDHAADVFVLREPLRTLRAATLLDVFRLCDKDGLYLGVAGAGKIEPLQTAAVAQSSGKIGRIATDLLQRYPDLQIYYTVIPDKSTVDGHAGVGFDVQQAEVLLGQQLPSATRIALAEVLWAADYYRTDLHWDQVALIRAGGVLDTLGASMGFSTAPAANYQVHEAGAFEGVYPGQLALPMQADTMRYLTDTTIDDLEVSYFDPSSGALATGSLYDLEAFAGRDPYDIFLAGSQPLVVLENPNALRQRELYLFRDSFGSSLGPLLAQGYSKVTLIDLRYLDYRALERYISIEPDSDVLFVYSGQILNNPTVLLAP
jgi:hypothetical protein